MHEIDSGVIITSLTFPKLYSTTALCFPHYLGRVWRDKKKKKKSDVIEAETQLRRNERLPRFLAGPVFITATDLIRTICIYPSMNC